MLRHIVQHRDVDFGALLDFFDLLGRFEQAVVGYDMTCRFNLLDAFVKINVTLLVLPLPHQHASFLPGFFMLTAP